MAWLERSRHRTCAPTGDAFVAAATGLIEAPIDEVRLLAVVAVEQAVRESVGSIEG